jgi:hypothetical protein
MRLRRPVSDGPPCAGRPSVQRLFAVAILTLRFTIGVRKMPEYRLYCLDGGGQIGFADWIEANDDGDAIAKAQRLKHNCQQLEVWRGTNLVAALDSHDLGDRPPT